MNINNLLKHSGILAFSTIIGGGLGYLYQILVGRLLGPEVYGVFGSLIAITYLIAILGQSIDTTTTKYISEFIGKNKGIKAIYISFLKKSLMLSFLVAIVLIFASSTLSTILNVGIKLLMLIVICFSFSIVTSVNIGCLKGQEFFVNLSGITISGHVVKLTVGILLILLGYGIYGAIGGFLAASVFLFIASLFLILRKGLNNDNVEFKIGYCDIHKYILYSLLLAFCMNVPTNMDVIFVKSFFTEYEAGLYTAASIFGKIQFYLSTSIIWALFPKISKKSSVGIETHHLLIKALLYISFISGLLAILYYLFPTTLLNTLYGHKYLDAGKFVKLYGTAMFLFSLFAVIVNYYMAKGEVHFVFAFFTITIIELIAFTIFNSSPENFIKIMIFGNFTGLILSFSNISLIKILNN